jgi:hypothetical protein
MRAAPTTATTSANAPHLNFVDNDIARVIERIYANKADGDKGAPPPLAKCRSCRARARHRPAPHPWPLSRKGRRKQEFLAYSFLRCHEDPQLFLRRASTRAPPSVPERQLSCRLGKSVGRIKAPGRNVQPMSNHRLAQITPAAPTTLLHAAGTRGVAAARRGRGGCGCGRCRLGSR